LLDYEAIFLDTVGLYSHGDSVLARSTAKLTQAVAERVIGLGIRTRQSLARLHSALQHRESWV